MNWKTLERPGFFGKKRDELLRGYDKAYGEGNWRIRWRWCEIVIPFETSCLIYEQGYFVDSFNREDIWKKLISEARDVYDHHESDVESGLDYKVQQGTSTHIQDITIRRVVERRGWEFKGGELIQIRSHKTYWGKMLSPGKVEFHRPELIVVPHLEGWWQYNSVEDYYQSNKVLQVRDDYLRFVSDNVREKDS